MDLCFLLAGCKRELMIWVEREMYVVCSPPKPHFQILFYNQHEVTQIINYLLMQCHHEKWRKSVYSMFHVCLCHKSMFYVVIKFRKCGGELCSGSHPCSDNWVKGRHISFAETHFLSSRVLFILDSTPFPLRQRSDYTFKLISKMDFAAEIEDSSKMSS